MDGWGIDWALSAVRRDRHRRLACRFPAAGSRGAADAEQRLPLLHRPRGPRPNDFGPCQDKEGQV